MARYGKAQRYSHRILNGVGILMLAAPVVYMAAAASAPNGKVTQYLIVSGDSMSGSWNSDDEPRIKRLRAKYGSNFVWLKLDGRDYIVTDSHVMAQLDDAMAPQREVNLRQDEVNRHQEEVNGLQEKVNGRQEEVNRAQEEVNRQQGLVNGGNAAQSRVNQLQAEVNGRQEAVNAEQDKVNQRQAVVNKEQGVVNGLQTRASAQIHKAMDTIFDSVRRQGLAREIQ
jgi:hypothetical protein